MSCKHKYTYIGAGEWECNLCREVVDKSDHISWVFESQSDRIAELEGLLREVCSDGVITANLERRIRKALEGKQ